MPATGEFAHDAVAAGYSIDSRTLQPGNLFFAIRGERVDGHDYVEAALSKGAVRHRCGAGASRGDFLRSLNCWWLTIPCWLYNVSGAGSAANSGKSR